MARRIGWDEPCLTLTCSPAQNKQKDAIQTKPVRLLFVNMHVFKPFRMNGNLYNSLSQQYKQIGNAVPVNLGREVGYSIIKFLNKYYNSSNPR